MAITLACARGGTSTQPPTLASSPPTPSAPAAYSAGLRLEHLDYRTPGGNTEVLTTAVWYPSTAGAEPFTYAVEADYTSHVALDGPAASFDSAQDPFPLVVYSHGAFSSAYSLAFFAEHLARNGYIVVAPDYLDSGPPDFDEPVAFSRSDTGKGQNVARVLITASQWVRAMNGNPEAVLAYLAEHRLGQTRFVIDQALAWNEDPASPFYQRIDPEKIGIVGWSLGGLTALGLIGAHPDPSARDGRIDAGLLLSAPPYPLQDNLASIGVPTMLMQGDDDENELGPQYPRRLIYEGAPPPKYYLVLNDTTHYDFGNRPAGTVPLYEAIQSVPGLNVIATYGLAFFDVYVKGDAAADAVLEGGHPGLDDYEETLGP
jgi:dienelactone hydrolase